MSWWTRTGRSRVTQTASTRPALPLKLPAPPDGPMAMPDYRDPSPDAGHEELRKPLADAIDSLQCEIERIDDAFLLLLSTTDFAASTLRTVLGAQAAMASLSARIAALEAAAKPAPEPTPPIDPPPEVAP